MRPCNNRAAQVQEKSRSGGLLPAALGVNLHSLGTGSFHDTIPTSPCPTTLASSHSLTHSLSRHPGSPACSRCCRELASQVGLHAVTRAARETWGGLLEKSGCQERVGEGRQLAERRRQLCPVGLGWRQMWGQMYGSGRSRFCRGWEHRRTGECRQGEIRGLGDSACLTEVALVLFHDQVRRVP